jgi:hypothetical protein
MAAAEVRAAKAAKAKVVNCILEELVGWFGRKLSGCLGFVDGLVERLCVDVL